MVKKLSFKEIGKRYDSEWVLLTDVEEDKYERIKRAVVLWHSPDKEEVGRKAIELRPGKFAFLYMGEKVPKGVGVLL
jgi:hypothetical protein